MKLISLIDNYTTTELKAMHGLSFYIETRNHKILFDLGYDDTLLNNAKKVGLDLSEVDIVIISHGHGDHGGALKDFLSVNKKAKIFVQQTAFDPYFVKLLFLKKSIGLDSKLKSHPQVVLINGDHIIDDELQLFVVTDANKCVSPANNVLYAKDGKDKFEHEQNLVIKEDKTMLILGCGHTGVVNILDKAKKYNPDICVGGYHLYNPITRKSAPESLLDDIAHELNSYQNTKFYTCHCTGKKAYEYLASKVPNLSYLSSGEEITTS